MLAWSVACLVGVCITTGCIYALGGTSGPRAFEPLLLMMVFAAIFIVALILTAPIAFIAVLILRTSNAPRPWADLVFGAAIASAAAALPLQIFFPGMLGENLLLPIALLSGVIAGATYWLIAGKPRPPYATDAPTHRARSQS